MIKARFADFYSCQSPTPYISRLVHELDYRAPFDAMDKFRPFLVGMLPNSCRRIAIAGSGYGLESAVLKYNATQASIVARWTDAATFAQPFPRSNSGVEATLIDQHPEPLRFAREVNLADHTFVADLGRPYSAELEKHLATRIDAVTAIGVTSYLNEEGFERLIRTVFAVGKAKLFCFSLLKYMDHERFVDICRNYGLFVQRLGPIRQRLYSDAGELERVGSTLREKRLWTDSDEAHLMSELYLASKG